jgi:biotin carboxyl carrier protein
MQYHVTINGRTLRVELDGERVRVDGEDFGAAQLATLPGTPVRHLLADGRSATVVAHRSENGWDLVVNGWPVQADVVDERTRAIQAMTGRGAAAQGPKPVRAPMPGLIVRVEVAPGDAVRQGQGVVIMEAMKMENELRAEATGTVGRVLVQPGEAVQKGAVLVEFEAPAP